LQHRSIPHLENISGICVVARQQGPDFCELVVIVHPAIPFNLAGNAEQSNDGSAEMLRFELVNHPIFDQLPLFLRGKFRKQNGRR
jgi:hypothetical protein